MSTDTLDPPNDRPGRGASTGARGSSGADRAAALATQQVDEMVAAWHRGERPRAEEILACHPELGDDAAIRLIYEEVCLRQEAGLEVDLAEIGRRFPRWRDELAVLLDCQRLMESAPTRVVFPHVGEVLAGFRLLAELGRGAAGRVFLAAQPSLGDRPVVVKVTPRGREEHLSLARLQHMNIVPLYSEDVLRDRNLQILCMPFLGGATLAQILEALESQPASERTGRQVVEALDRIQARRPDGLQSAGPFRRFIARATYVEAICSIGAALADGLQYAHERDLVHMDVKPSNALLASDGQPMLLDFHLARGPIAPDSLAPAWMGGTLEFMSPEQRQAMAAVRSGRPVRDAVDGRADIFSLGMLLYVALGGTVPESCDAPLPSLHRCNPRVSVGLSAIIHKCLCNEAGNRYPDAAALAGDLRRHLADLPLRGVPNRSWVERWRKWRRRHPSVLSRYGLTLLVLAAAAGASSATLAIAYRQRRDAVAAARVGRVAGLHALAESIRFRYGISPPPADEAPALIRLGRKTWEARKSLLHRPDGVREPEIERRVRTDLRDLVVLWADLRVRYAAADEINEARKEAVGILTEASAFLGPSPSLERDRRAYTQAIGFDDGPSAPEAEPRSAWEHCDLGWSYLRSGRPELAAEQFRRGLALRPHDFWLNFYEGQCDYRLGRFDEAVNAFRVCIALAPETAECYYNRALSYQALGRLELALADLDRALQLSPVLPDAALNRGIIHYRQGHHDAAIDDLERALRMNSSRTTLAIIHYNLALVHQARGDREATASSARAAMAYGNPDARELVRRLALPNEPKSSPRPARAE